MKMVPIVLPIVALIGWFIRLEAKVLYLEKNHVEHKENSKEKENALWAKQDAMNLQMAVITQTLARIEENIKQLKEK